MAIFDLLFDIAGMILELVFPSTQSKCEKNIIRLREESWFSELEMDFRYDYIIHQNRKVVRFLSIEKNIKMILSMEEEKERFINLVKEEHARFTRLH